MLPNTTTVIALFTAPTTKLSVDCKTGVTDIPGRIVVVPKQGQQCRNILHTLIRFGRSVHETPLAELELPSGLLLEFDGEDIPAHKLQARVRLNENSVYFAYLRLGQLDERILPCAEFRLLSQRKPSKPIKEIVWPPALSLS